MVDEFCSTKVEFDHDSGTEKHFVDTIDHTKVRCAVEFSSCNKFLKCFADHMTTVGLDQHYGCLLCSILGDEVKFMFIKWNSSYLFFFCITC